MFDLEALQISYEAHDGPFTAIAIIILLCATTNFAFLNHQILGIAGSRGLYPLHKRILAWQSNFGLGTRLKHSPVQWSPVAWWINQRSSSTSSGILAKLLRLVKPANPEWRTNQALKALTIIGAVTALLTAASLAIEPNAITSLLMWSLWLQHLWMQETCFMFFPWHSMISECLFILSVGLTPLLAFGTDLAGATNAGVGPTTGLVAPSFALRLLVFRILVGFGQIKFKGATKDDYLYIKPFVPAIPICSRLGLLMYKYLPNWFFYMGYLFFFLSEIVIPLFFFSPVFWHRLVGAFCTAKLMLGIMLSGNFGNFNILTAAVGLIVPCNVFMAPSTVPAEGFAAGGAMFITLQWLVTIVLTIHSIGGLMLMPFNSWVQQAWFNWTSLRVAHPLLAKVNGWFEVCCHWRILHPYGIFPPNIFSAQRQLPKFEGSRDGKTWIMFHYKHQPLQPHDVPSTIPGVHPFMDFAVFYQLGYWGFLRSSIYTQDPTWNMHCRPVDAIARNILEGGDVYSLFKQTGPFSPEMPPRYIRATQVMLRPVQDATVGSHPDDFLDEQGREILWSVEQGQLEVPVTSLNNLHTLPSPVVTRVSSELDYSMRVWRLRAKAFALSKKKASAQKNKDQSGGVDAIVNGVNDEDETSLTQKLLEIPDDLVDRSAAVVNPHVELVLKRLKTRFEKLSADALQVLKSIDSIPVHALDLAIAASDKRHEEQALSKGKPTGVSSPTPESYFSDALAVNELHFAANEAADALVGAGFPFSGEHPDGSKKMPTSAFQVYLFVLTMIREAHAGGTPFDQKPEDIKAKMLRFADAEEPKFMTSKEAIDDKTCQAAEHNPGLTLFVTMFARTVRLECSLFRRMAACAMVVPTRIEERPADILVPGYLAYWRSVLQRNVPFMWPSRASNAEGDFGAEHQFTFAFDKKKGLHQYLGRDQPLPNAVGKVKTA